ncbi:MAG: PAS domain S-box protein [Pyrinomonadaceae bacterium]
MAQQSVSAVRDADGGRRSVLAVVVDITRRKEAAEWERRAAAEALAAAEADAKFRTFFEQGANFAGVLTLDGTVVEANRLCLDACGFTRDEVIGKKFWDCGWWNPSPALMEMVRRGTSEAAKGRLFRQESSYFVADGSERVVELVIAPVKDEAGRVMFLAPTGTDITERKKTEEELRQSEAQYRALADAMPQIVYTCDPEGRADYVNRQWYEQTGITYDGAQGFDWAAALHPEDLEPTLERWLESVRTGLVFETEYRIKHAGGGYHWHLSRAVPTRDAAGRVVKWFGSSTDIHARRLAEAERERLLARETELRAAAEETGRLKDEFLATLSHELRTPLTAILGWAALMRDDKLAAAVATKGLEVIERNARAQQQLIEDLMDVSRIITGKLWIDLRPVELAPVVEQAVESARPAAEAKGIHLRHDLDRQVGPVSGDPARLQQVVWNLLTNAIKFTPAGGRVEVRVERADAHVLIMVGDTGQGISREFLPYVFDRFRQQDGKSTRAHGGMGLGLSIVRHLVEMHGGTVRADSSGHGHGSTFTITLPLIAVQREPGDKSSRPTAAAGAGGVSPDCPVRLDGLRVLVVDDDADALQIITLMLEECGAEVLSATSAAKGLVALEREKPDALISDIGMPGEDGFDLIRRVRELPADRGGRTPAAALTAYAGAEERKRILLSGFQLHVPKPIEPAELAAVVASLAGHTAGT